MLLISEDKDDLSDQVLKVLLPFGFARQAILLALAVAVAVTVWSQVPTSKSGSATKTMEEAAPYFRAAFLLQSAQRVTDGLKAGRTQEQLLAQEQRYMAQHLDAMSNRRRAVMDIDATAKRLGTAELGWYTTMDNRTSQECRAANGKNFTVGRMPVIGYPGAVHPSCRCKAGPRHAGAKLLKAA